MSTTTTLLILLHVYSIRVCWQSISNCPYLTRGRLLLAFSSPPSSLLDVRLDVEVSEEADEREGVADESVVHPLGKVAVDVERMEGMDYGKTELKLCVGKKVGS